MGDNDKEPLSSSLTGVLMHTGLLCLVSLYTDQPKMLFKLGGKFLFYVQLILAKSVVAYLFPEMHDEFSFSKGPTNN